MEGGGRRKDEGRVGNLLMTVFVDSNSFNFTKGGTGRRQRRKEGREGGKEGGRE